MDEQTLDLVEEEIKRAEALLARDIDDIKAEGAALGIGGTRKGKGLDNGAVSRSQRRAAGQPRLSTDRRKEVIAQLRATQMKDGGAKNQSGQRSDVSQGARTVADGGLIDRVLEEHGLQGIEKGTLRQPTSLVNVGGDSGDARKGSGAEVAEAPSASVLSAAAAARGGIVDTSGKAGSRSRNEVAQKAKPCVLMSSIWCIETAVTHPTLGAASQYELETRTGSQDSSLSFTIPRSCSTPPRQVPIHHVRSLFSRRQGNRG